MRKIILVALALFLGACASSTTNLANRPAGFEGSNLPKSVVKHAKSRVNDNGYLELELVLKSTFAKDVMYKIEWLDKDGFVLRNVLDEGYETLRIPANQEVVLRKLAFDKRAVNFKIDMKTKN